MNDQPTVSDIFRRALEIRQSNASISYNDIKKQIVSEFGGKAFGMLEQRRPRNASIGVVDREVMHPSRGF